MGFFARLEGLGVCHGYLEGLWYRALLLRVARVSRGAGALIQSKMAVTELFASTRSTSCFRKTFSYMEYQGGGTWYWYCSTIRTGTRDTSGTSIVQTQ